MLIEKECFACALKLNGFSLHVRFISLIFQYKKNKNVESLVFNVVQSFTRNTRLELLNDVRLVLLCFFLDDACVSQKVITEGFFGSEIFRELLVYLNLGTFFV